MHFDENVWKICRKIPKGKVTTYGEIARKLKTSPRTVGQALKRNPTPVKVPCHRVVRSSGKIGGYAGLMSSKKKAQLLRKEGVKVERGWVADFDKVLYRFE